MKHYSHLKKMKILVTGGAGFIGSHLVEKLINGGHYVICVDDFSSGLIRNIRENDLLKVVNNKIQNIELTDLQQNIDCIYHLAAQSSVPLSIDNYYKSSSNNLLGCLKVWDLAIKLDIPIVYASSSAVYGDLPIGNDKLEKYEILSPYAQDKLTMEHYARMCWNVYRIPSIGLRFFNVYGPRQDPTNPYSGVISIFIDRLMQNQPVTVNGGYQTRDFIFIKDIIEVMLRSMESLINKRSCDILNVGTGESITIDYLLNTLADIMRIKPKVVLKELLPGDPEQSGGSYESLIDILKIDINHFTKIEEGLKSTIEFISKDQGQ